MDISARERHPNVFICPYADDTNLIGNPADVIAAIVTIREEYATAGLALATTTADKMYCLVSEKIICSNIKY